MKQTIKRKQFLLPQNLIDEVKKIYKAKTETEAIVVSLHQALRRKKLEQLANMAGKVKMNLTVQGLRKLRAKERAY